MTISIITINYDNLDGLEKTIASVMSQTWRDFEWIIIDGGSQDGSKEVIEALASNPEANVTYWCSEPDKGVYNAQNKGIQHAKGEYMSFLNSGDTYYDENTLSKVWSMPHTYDVVYGDWLWCYPDHEVLADCPHKANMATFYVSNICHQAMFIKSSILQEEGYDESFRIYADWARWMKLACDGGSFEYVPYTICRFAMGGISGKWNEQCSLEGDRIRAYPPSQIKDCMELYEKAQLKLNQYEEYPFNREALDLMHERVLYRRLLHAAVTFTTWIKRIVDIFPNS